VQLFKVESMKVFKIIIIFLLATQLCGAQDTTIVLSSNMLEKFNDKINLGKLDGWGF